MRHETPGPLTRLLEKLAELPDAGPAGAWACGLMPGELIAGRYEILREIGRGAFGAVFEAVDRELGRRVALKTLRPGRARDEWANDQLRAEARAAARLAHPGVVTLFEAGTGDRGPYLVMELLRGETLDARLLRGPIPAIELVEIGLQLAQALTHVHAQGLVHRDLKPANVFLGQDGRVKLLDLGLAHLLGREGGAAGTPAYVAPEQWRGQPVDGRADVFALGAILFEALCGQRPFQVKEDRSTALDPGRAPALPEKRHRRLGSLVARCLEKDPHGRPTASQVVDDLLDARRSLGGEATRRWALLAIPAAALGVAGAALLLGTGTPPRPASPLPPSVAVLPFADMSPGQDHAYLADGLAEEILHSLAQLAELRVIGRTSSFALRGQGLGPRAIGERLGVGALLEGSIRRDGDRLRISADLVRVTDGARLWSQAFDRQFSDVLAVQVEIAREVARALEVRLLPGRDHHVSCAGTPEAYDRYLRGLQLLRRGAPGDFPRARTTFEAAVALGPTCAAAWAGASEAAFLGETYDPGQQEARRQALEAAERAIVLGPDIPAGYQARAAVRLHFAYDFEGAMSDTARALELSPNDAASALERAHLLGVLGRAAEAVSVARKATEMDPLYARAWATLGLAHGVSGDPAAARVAWNRALEVSPGNPIASELLATHLVAWGESREALAIAGRTGVEWLQLTFAALAEPGQPAGAAALDVLSTKYAEAAAYQIAQVHAWLGRPDRAFEWLERAFDQRDTGLVEVRVNPLLRPLHGDRRWHAFVARMRLPPD